MADDEYKKTPDDQFVSTDADKWILINCTVAIGAALTAAWSFESPAPAVVNLPDKQDLAWAENDPSLYTVTALPDKQDLTWAVQSPVCAVILPVSKQDLTYTLQPTSSAQFTSRNCGSWTTIGTPTTSQNQSGVDEIANIAWTIGDDSALAYESVIYELAVAADSQTHCASVYILKDSDTTHFPSLQVLFTGGTVKSSIIQLNTSTGETIQDTGTPAATGSVDAGLWWRFYVSLANNGTNTLLTIRIQPARGTVFGTGNTAATGTIVVDAVQIDLNASTPSQYFALSPIVLVTPDKQDATWALEAPAPAIKHLPSGAQSLTWAIQSPSVSGTTGKTIYPSALTATWSLKTISISSGDYFKDTDDDKWVDGTDKWQFKSGGTTACTVFVDKQTLAWSAAAPSANFDCTVYPYSYLKDQAGFPIRDEAGNPIPLEDAMTATTLTWSVQAPTIYKSPEVTLYPNEIHLTWTVNSVIVAPTSTPDAQTLAWTLNTPLRAQLPDALDLTWTLNDPDIKADIAHVPDALELTWNINSPAIHFTGKGHTRRKGLLLGIYRG